MTKRYGVILADPPWSYERSGVQGAAEGHYSVMDDKDLYSMPIPQIALDDSVLLLWATWPKLVEAMNLISAWGFEYVTGMPWVKIIDVPRTTLWGEWEFRIQYGIGFWIRGATEPILIARRGHVSPPTDNWIGLLCESIHHSRKPDNIYQYAESLPGPYLEMFARRSRPGWDVFGNEVSGSIALYP